MNLEYNIFYSISQMEFLTANLITEYWQKANHNTEYWQNANHNTE